MWIKLVAENIVVIGITEKMSELMDKIYSLYLPEIDHKLTKEGYFGYGEAAKLNVEFVSPVSGTVRQINNELYIDIEMHVNNDPYVSGWMVTIELSNPEELDELLTPQGYTDLNAKVL
jgi:glycine cleavage system H protein